MIVPDEARFALPAVTGAVDATPWYLAHDAFARDLRRLAMACLAGRAWTPRAAATWSTVRRQMAGHLRSTDERARIEADARLAGEAYEARTVVAFYDRLYELAHSLDRHACCAELPQLAVQLPVSGWELCAAPPRRPHGPGGAAEYYPWLLDGATPSARRAVLAAVPARTRWLHNTFWQRRYRRSHLTDEDLRY